MDFTDFLRGEASPREVRRLRVPVVDFCLGRLFSVFLGIFVAEDVFERLDFRRNLWEARFWGIYFGVFGGYMDWRRGS